jgi:hypothetical protein
MTEALKTERGLLKAFFNSILHWMAAYDCFHDFFFFFIFYLF